ncbi:DUF2894 domain-containing protein [Variovorax sp. WS11]|uniref:DUF2894 domain-containing protein n=1 Tax=Variovorax sp. WS11 TaxID=1105204 RepID=UPI000D0D0920|nr:DUF2894 domain-containing protein [Variovorax sp. WS11]NDZ11932.1 DUF2894 domain-containing protein [Variovorax sp. WS11]PSL82691.1 DUF2894 domain-containing protein [Variovorax sp. WS11]
MDAGAMIDACRARGDHRRDPVRFRFIEALARRAATHHGETRHILDTKVRELLAAYAEDLGKIPAAEGTSGAAQKGQAPRGPLAELVDAIARPASSQGEGAITGASVPGLSSSSSQELKTLSYFRSTWSRLSADRRLTQTLAAVPENAGPLNSHQLVHRALMLMRELSPEYLHRFMSHVDALLWLDRANAGSASAGAEAPRAEGQRKSGRGKAG